MGCAQSVGMGWELGAADLSPNWGCGGGSAAADMSSAGSTRRRGAGSAAGSAQAALGTSEPNLS